MGCPSPSPSPPPDPLSSFGTPPCYQTLDTDPECGLSQIPRVSEKPGYSDAALTPSDDINNVLPRWRNGWWLNPNNVNVNDDDDDDVGPKQQKNENENKTGRRNRAAKWILTRVLFVCVAYTLACEIGSSMDWLRRQFQYPGGSRCSVTIAYDRHKTYSFPSPNTFKFRQASRRGSSTGTINVRGEVSVHGGGGGGGAIEGGHSTEASSDHISVDFDIKFSNERLKDAISFEVSDEGIAVITDFTSNIPTYLHDCIEIKAIVSVPAGHNLSTLDIHTEALAIGFSRSLQARSDETSLTTLSGDIVILKEFESNKIQAKTLSGNIQGNFMLRDMLRLSTDSGYIKANVTLDPSFNSSKSEFKATSISGDITTLFPTPPVINRTILSIVSTTSGAISGSYLLGSHLSLSSIAGYITASVSPSGEKSATLWTENKSGDTFVSFDNHSILGNGNALSGTHQSISGDLKLRYPKDWEGSVTGRSISGDLMLSGDGLRVIEDRRLPGLKFISGVKGSGRGVVAGSCISGDFSFRSW